jgi:3-hydroxyacyl-CoA dehydrogenase/enoyl-CoA hydratase/3-hydroxybutyryl-CoA epimerase
VKKNIQVQTQKDGVAIVTFDMHDAEVNVLNEAFIRELDQTLDDLKQNSSVKGVVFVSAKKDFIVGADIKEFKRLNTVAEATEGSRFLQSVFHKVATLGKPSCAAIKGNCMGGGLEFALACTWRVAADTPKTVLALPEIQLGLLPGAGGTQRLPRLIGIQDALDLILTGKNVRVAKALKLGLIDAKVPENLLQLEAQSLALQTRKSKGQAKAFDVSVTLPKWALESNSIGRKFMASKAKEMVEEKSKGFYPAPYKALEAIFRGFDRPIEEGLQLEAALFGELLVTSESKSLVHLFFATTALKKNPYQEAVRARFGKEKAKCIGVVGSGFMGAGIATVCADRGMRVLMSDPSHESLQRAMVGSRSYFRKLLERKRIKKFEMEQKMAFISPALSPQGFERCDIAIEAVFEDMGLKQKILRNIENLSEEHGNKDWIFASNTSALPLAEIAKNTAHKDRICGMHFFSPVEKMPLLEIIVTDQTADWVAGRAFEVGQAMGKQIIVVKDSPGFYTTRALAFFIAEAAGILSQGVPIEFIDKALTRIGFPVGPITLIDEVGIDVGMHVLETIKASFHDRLDIPDGLTPLVESGRKGRKNQLGFYHYENGKRGSVDQSVYKILGITPNNPSQITQQEVADRCVLQFVNESAHCLGEGVLSKAYDGDVGAVFGLGFPPFWGGPFKYVDLQGADTIVKKLEEYAEKYGKRFQPAPILVEAARKKTRFFPEED